MAKIIDFITTKQATAATKAVSAAAAALANQKLADDTAADDTAEARTARALKLIGPTLVSSSPPESWDSPDGVRVHVTPLNSGDVEVPEDPPLAAPAA